MTSGIYEYDVLNHAIICLYYFPQKACNFHMQVFQIKLKYHCSKPIKLQKFLMQQYKPCLYYCMRNFCNICRAVKSLSNRITKNFQICCRVNHVNNKIRTGYNPKKSFVFSVYGQYKVRFSTFPDKNGILYVNDSLVNSNFV